jgi:hypothetical protein
MVATARGKSAALEELAARRQRYRQPTWPPNESLPAGSLMTFACIACGGPITVPESYLSKPETCAECDALIALGWME